MFQNDMTETKEGRLVICDVEPKVLKEFLYFIYSGELTDSWEMDDVINLLNCAEKYQIESLKLKCAKLILTSKKISLTNALNIYILGKLCNVNSIVQKALEVLKQWVNYLSKFNFR